MRSNRGQTSGGPEQRLGEVIVDGHPWPLVIDDLAARFEARVGEHVAFITFHVHGSALSLLHTETPPALRGKHVADALAEAALNYARAHQMTVKPYCSFVAAYIRRHPEHERLIDPDFPAAAAAGEHGTREGRK